MGARLAGANPIIAIDVEDDKLALAQEVGATHAVRGDGDVPADVRAIVPDGVDYAFEAIGLLPTIELMPALLARGGTAVLVGHDAGGRARVVRRLRAPWRPTGRSSAPTTAAPSRPSTSRSSPACTSTAGCRSTG